MRPDIVNIHKLFGQKNTVVSFSHFLLIAMPPKKPPSDFDNNITSAPRLLMISILYLLNQYGIIIFTFCLNAFPIALNEIPFFRLLLPQLYQLPFFGYTHRPFQERIKPSLWMNGAGSMMWNLE
jgi:hypothetical protein